MNINQKASINIKGLLILLIVIGHNHLLVPINSFLMEWLYNFHVLIFFILPMFYKNDNKHLSIKYIIDLIVRNWTPYLFTTIIALAINSIININFTVNSMTLFAFLNGSTTMTGKYLGATFLWFLPTYCTFSILHILAQKYKILKISILFLGLIFWFLTWEQFEYLKIHSLFGIPMAIKCFSLGYLTKILFKKQYIINIGFYIFIIITILLFYYPQNNYLFNIIWPISAFCFVFSIQNLLKDKLFSTLGKYSLIIYLIHVFIYQFIKYITDQGFFWSISNLIATIAISILIASIIDKITLIKKLYTPRKWKDLRYFYIK